MSGAVHLYEAIAPQSTKAISPFVHAGPNPLSTNDSITWDKGLGGKKLVPPDFKARTPEALQTLQELVQRRHVARRLK
jgi:hypothetical protein